MPEQDRTVGAFLTPEELVQRWRGKVKLSTLKSWRHGRFKTGPAFIRMREPNGPVLYPLEEVEAYERKNQHLTTRG